ncbi:Fe(2+) transporter permease subunit FeoB [Thermosynechococcus vestitus]|uniref:Ferrous iron transport protein B n=1 Tax=Thermosynechococcus vestitus (strain NIES-2133 / IAM M-273 / BP-1) TaxID=197221 RepID=Q8DI51_THEVB|nr:Fe(2+) transporter permease subunit FeoB [Thermosynechococcus vestitus]BAC09292.1 ferrous iron transport protein B [Thermosynechococcus vestitus BP-1]
MAAIIALIGNPNCGKTTIFNGLTGANQRVGNWPGVTVERKQGGYRDQDLVVEVVDLPGVYALDAEESTGVDEQIARNFLLEGEYDLVINILDAANLERNFYLTTQLLDRGVPLILVLNMIDRAQANGMSIDTQGLSQRLGIPVLPFCAKQKAYFDQLRQAIRLALQDRPISTVRAPQPPIIEEAITDLLTKGAKDRGQALAWLQYLESVPKGEVPQLHQWRRRIHQTLEEDIDLVIADSRYRWIQHLMADVLERGDRPTTTISDRIDRIVLNRWLGIPIFLAVMYMVFLISINVGGAFIDFFDIGVGALVVGWPTQVLQTLHAPGWLIGLLAEGVGGGIQTTATFIPQIGLLFIFLTLLEDSGYLARAAFVMDRMMQWLGLPGKSFVPMLVSFGCNIPGIMATRVLENRRDRLMTILMNPFMSCGARLPIYALFVAAFFPRNGQNIVFSLYLLGIVAAIFTGFVIKRTLFQGEIAPFVMELPPYHLPTLRGVFLRAWERLKTFLSRAGKMIVLLVLILGLLNSVGTDGSFGKQDSTQSILSAFSRQITPIFSPMGIQPDNWPATVGLFTGVFAKEVMVGTMDALYTELARQENQEASAGEEVEPFSVWEQLRQAVLSIPQNLSELGQQMLDPLGFQVLQEAENPEAAAEVQEVHYTTFGQMAKRFRTPTAAIAFLIFVLLYFPCVSATAAVYRETNLSWTIFVTTWTTGLAYWVATAYYQIMTFAAHPVFSALCLVGLGAVMAIVIMALKYCGDRRRLSSPQEV